MAGLSKRLRFEVFKRDHFTCQYCGKRPPDAVLEVDHVVPKCEGGPDTAENLTTACYACNRGKAGVSLGNVAPALDELEVLAGVQEMMERKINLERSIAVTSAKREAEQKALDAALEWWEDDIGDPEMVDVTSMRRFIDRMGLDGVESAITATAVFSDANVYASPSRLWKYFCGVAWKMIRASGTEGDADE
jgi:hypothetical protein